MARIVILDNLSEDGLKLLDEAPGIEYEIITGLAGEELRKTLAEFDGAICRSGVTITAESLEGNTRLKAIARAGVGTNNIDKVAATRIGAVVMNTPGGNTISTAEQTIALMLAMSRNLAPAYQSLIEGRWDRKKFMGTQLADKTLGIIGLGRIGQAVAQRAKALEMRLIGYDPLISSSMAQSLGIELVDSPRDMLHEVDYLTVHTPLTDETRGLIGAEEIKMIKKGARLINCARGGIYDEEAMVEGLKSGQLAGVALDVYPSEPCTDSPLFGMDGVLCSPHLGASTEEAQTNVAVEAAQLLIDFFTKGIIKQSVNVSPLDPETIETMRGSLDLAHRLGLFFAGIENLKPKSIRLGFKGEIAEQDTGLLSSAFAAGLLQNAMEVDVTIINAVALLKERKISLDETRSSETSVFSSLIQVDIESEERTITVAGTLFGNNMPRLVQFGDCRLESYLDGNLLIFHHQDRPGVIGRVGNIFGKYEVNIAQMTVGRTCEEPGGKAVGILSLDAVPSKEAIEEVFASDGVESGFVVKLPPAGELPSWLAQ